MAKTLSTFPVSVARTSEKRKYLDGQVWQIGPEECGKSASTFRSGLYTVASEIGVKFRSRILPDGSLVVQAHKPKDAA